MVYSHWEDKKNIKNYLEKVNYRENVERSGLPIIYEKDSIYVSKNDGHSLVVGATGSGKTQAFILPLVKLSMLANESLVINDPKGDIYKKTAKEFKNRGYNTLLIDFDTAIYGNYFNSLTLPYRLYNENNKDKCLTIVEEIGYYLFTDIKDSIDPFWENSAIDYFTGICLYLFKNSKREVNLNDVFELANKLLDDKECEIFLNEISKSDPIYYSVSGTLTAPSDTRRSIISTFNQRLKKYVSKENLSKLMSKSDFDISKIANNKTVIYIVSGYYDYNSSLIPLFINQVFEAINIYGNERKVNIILDEFDNLLPIKGFAEIINYARSIKINFTCVIKSFVNLLNAYGKDNIEIIKLCFSNIVYLYANDLYTLNEISKLCGNESDKTPLVSPEELKMLKSFEAIFLMPRLMPYKELLIPDYKINWGINFEETEFELRK